MPTPYTTRFYQKDLDVVLRSARQIVPLVMELVSPQSVVDVGCGIGAWLSVFAEHGVRDYLGVDGDYVEPAMLRIPRDRFVAYDLTMPLRMERRFELVVSLEVAEHLPASAAAGFVRSLTGLGPAVLFSAAVPYQGGAHHVNEQWPDYWARLFADQGYAVLDCIRRRVWNNEEVAEWYAQNTLIFVREELLARPRLKAERDRTVDSQLAMVHPRMYLKQHEMRERMEAVAKDLASVLTPGERFVLADEEQFRTIVAGGYRAIPFMERNGEYWGPPADDQAAIEALECQRQRGARFFVVGWPAFWWLEYYGRFAEHLRERYRVVLENERVVVFAMG